MAPPMARRPVPTPRAVAERAAQAQATAERSAAALAAKAQRAEAKRALIASVAKNMEKLAEESALSPEGAAPPDPLLAGLGALLRS